VPELCGRPRLQDTSSVPCLRVCLNLGVKYHHVLSPVYLVWLQFYSEQYASLHYGYAKCELAVFCGDIYSKFTTIFGAISNFWSGADIGMLFP
jgi:hypothetical protein